MSPNGQVAGSSYGSLGVAQAVVWQGSGVTALNALGGSSAALGINASGQSAGYAFTPGVGRRAVVWQGTTPNALAEPIGTFDAIAVGINDSGQVAGRVSPTFGGGYQAVRWTVDRPVLLEGRGGRSSVATGINNAGDIAGYIENIDGSGFQKPVVWRGTQAVVLNSLQETVCCNQANALNDRGQVAGQSSAGGSGTVRAVVWNGVEPTSLTALSDVDFALGLNNVGQVVGAMNAGGGFRTAALWDLNTGVGVDLNSFLGQAEVDAGWILYSAFGINDYGVIVGEAFNRPAGSFRPFQLTPVPEQGTLTLLLAGLLTLAALRALDRRRRQ